MSSLSIVCPHCFTGNRVPHNRLNDEPGCGKCHEALFSGKPSSVGTADQFDKMIGSNGIPVVVDFWAEWCGPCKMFAPVFEQAAQAMEPAIRFIKVDTEALPEVTSRFRIQSIPTLAIFKDGSEFTRQAGAMPLARFREWVESNVSALAQAS